MASRDRTDTATAIAAALTLLGYVGLVALGEVDMQPGYIESLLIIALSALGFDHVTDRLAEKREQGDGE